MSFEGEGQLSCKENGSLPYDGEEDQACTGEESIAYCFSTANHILLARIEIRRPRQKGALKS